MHNYHLFCVREVSATSKSVRWTGGVRCFGLEANVSREAKARQKLQQVTYNLLLLLSIRRQGVNIQTTSHITVNVTLTWRRVHPAWARCYSPLLGRMRVDQAVPADAVGRRVSCGDERATVRFAGPVPPTAGKIRDVSRWLLLTNQGWVGKICARHLAGLSPYKGESQIANILAVLWHKFGIFGFLLA